MHDTHAHLDLLLNQYFQLEINSIDKLKSLPTSKITELKNFVKDQVKDHDWVIQPTVSTTNFELCFEFFQEFTKIYFLLGSHPEIVDNNFKLNHYLSEQSRFLKKIKSQKQVYLKKLIGIGEVGLDYFYSQDSFILDTQQKLFQSQIELSLNLNLPLIIHCREAFADLFAILKNNPQILGKFLIHCFTGNQQELKQVLDLGGKVAYGGIITFGKNAEILRETAKYCPVDSLVLETDLPFLAPTPFCGKLNLPKYIQHVAQKIAELKQAKTETVWTWSEENSSKLFQLTL